MQKSILTADGQVSDLPITGSLNLHASGVLADRAPVDSPKDDEPGCLLIIRVPVASMLGAYSCEMVAQRPFKSQGTVKEI